MALRKTIDVQGAGFVKTPYGTIDNGVQRATFSAYIKVASIAGDKSEVVATVSFSSETAKLEKQYTVPVSVESGSANFIAQTYAHLKTLPEFAGATDC
jgi:hypothetical protein